MKQEHKPAVISARELSVARWTVVLAGLLWSTSGFFAKAPDFDGWNGPVIAVWRAVFASLFLLPLIRQPQWSWKLIPLVIAFVAMNYTYLTAMKLGTAANAIWLQCTAPAWVMLVSVLFLGEVAKLLDWMMLAFGALGISLILFFEWQELAVKPSGFYAAAWALASGMLYTTVILFLRSLRSFNPIWLTGLNLSCTALFLPLMIWAADLSAGQPYTEITIPSTLRQWLLLAGFGIFQIGMPYVLFSRAMKTIPPHEATSIGLIEPILVPVWVYLFWNESPRWWTTVGATFILIGLLLRYAPWDWLRRR